MHDGVAEYRKRHRPAKAKPVRRGGALECLFRRLMEATCPGRQLVEPGERRLLAPKQKDPTRFVADHRLDESYRLRGAARWTLGKRVRPTLGERSAVVANRTLGALRRLRQADQRSEFHERFVPAPRVAVSARFHERRSG